MSTSIGRGLVGLAVMIGTAGAGFWSGRIGQGSPNLEVRDDAGKVRCVLGKLDGGGYGLRILGEGQQSMELSVESGAMTIQGKVREGSPFSLVGNSDGWLLTLKEAESAVRLSLDGKGGVQMVHATKDSGVLFAIKSEPFKDGVTALELRHPANGDKDTGVALIADARGASMDLLRGGASAAQLASTAAGGVAYLLLGARNLGVYLQATTAGNMLIELCNRFPRLTMQSTEAGTGIGIDRASGSTAMRLGLNKVGEIVRNIWTESGQQVTWDDDSKK
jgi:hypothetical protein